jgi:hypothetical protein
MTPAGQNYPIHEHEFLFWGLYLGGIVTVTIVLLGLFILVVHRSSQATRADLRTPPLPATPVAPVAPAETTPELPHVA